MKVATQARERRGLLRRTEGRLITAQQHIRDGGVALAEGLELVDADLTPLANRAAELNEAALMAAGEVLDEVRRRLAEKEQQAVD